MAFLTFSVVFDHPIALFFRLAIPLAFLLVGILPTISIFPIPAHNMNHLHLGRHMATAVLPEEMVAETDPLLMFSLEAFKLRLP